MVYGYWFGDYKDYEYVKGKHHTFSNAVIAAFKEFKRHEDKNLWFIFEEERPYVITIMKYTLEKNNDEDPGYWGVDDVLEYWELPVELDEHQKEWVKKYGGKTNS